MNRCVMSLGRILSFREDTFLYEMCVSSGTDVNILLFVRTFSGSKGTIYRNVSALVDYHDDPKQVD